MVALKSLIMGVIGLCVAGACLADSTVYPCKTPAGHIDYTVQFKKPSLFGDVLVVDGDDKRYLRFGDVCGSDQSSIDLLDANHVIVEYVRHASLSLAFAQRQQRVLVVGMGGGVFSNLLAKQLPDVKIDAIEIDPVVVEAAKKYFDVQSSDQYRIHVQDAAEFISQTKNRYDIILLDAYDSDGIPEHLTSKVFFHQVAKLLQADGVVVANFGLDSPLVYLRLAKRLRETLGDTRCLHGIEEANLVVIAASAKTMKKVNPITNAKRLDKSLSLSYSLNAIAKQLKVCPTL